MNEINTAIMHPVSHWSQVIKAPKGEPMSFINDLLADTTEQVKDLAKRVSDLEIELTKLVNAREPGTPEPGEGWRLLKKWELTEEGDETWNWERWVEYHMPGTPVIGDNYYRRRIPAEPKQPLYREPTRADLVEAWSKGCELLCDLWDREQCHHVADQILQGIRCLTKKYRYLTDSNAYIHARVRINADGTLHADALRKEVE